MDGNPRNMLMSIEKFLDWEINLRSGLLFKQETKNIVFHFLQYFFFLVVLKRENLFPILFCLGRSLVRLPGRPLGILGTKPLGCTFQGNSSVAPVEGFRVQDTFPGLEAISGRIAFRWTDPKVSRMGIPGLYGCKIYSFQSAPTFVMFIAFVTFELSAIAAILTLSTLATLRTLDASRSKMSKKARYMQSQLNRLMFAEVSHYWSGY